MEDLDLVNWLAGEPEVQMCVKNGSIICRVIHGGRLVKKYEQSMVTRGDPNVAIAEFQGCAINMTRLAMSDLVAVAKGLL